MMFARSAPARPAVMRAISSILTLWSSLMSFICTRKISILPLKSGLSTSTCLSNLPGLKSAASSTSGRFVAASTITGDASELKPSISAKSWFSVCSRSSFPPIMPLAARLLPMASISSIKTIAGASFFAFSKRSLTRLAPTPTNISIKLDPETEKNGTSASPATAFASKVLPVPGGPTKSTPFGILAPKFIYLSGCFRKSTISLTSSLASCTPATSVNLTFGFSEFTSFLELPIPRIPLPMFRCIRLAKNIQIPKKIKIGSTHEKIISVNQFVSL